MSGVKAFPWVRMQNTSCGNPSGQDTVPPLPQDPASLAAPLYNPPPQLTQPVSEKRELRQVPRHSVVLIAAIPNPAPTPALTMILTHSATPGGC